MKVFYFVIDTLTFHVKALGDWTSLLYDSSAALQQKKDDSIEPKKVNTDPGSLESSCKNVSFPLVFLDGLYHACTTELLQARRAVLIAGGIDVTPFLSVLANLLNEYKRQKSSNNASAVQSIDWLSGHKIQLEAVDFVWVFRNDASLKFGRCLLENWLKEQKEIPLERRFFCFNLFFTSKPIEASMHEFGPKNLPQRGFFHRLYRWTEILRRKQTLLDGGPTLDGPHWKEVFSEIAQRQIDPTWVLYCGPQKIERQLRLASARRHFRFCSEYFF